MSVTITFLFPKHVTQADRSFYIGDFLVPDQDNHFFGHILDMSIRSSDDSNIPKKPSMNVIEMTQEYTVVDANGRTCIPDQNFYLCRAGEFRKLPSIKTSHRNNVIQTFLQTLDPESFVVIHASW